MTSPLDSTRPDERNYCVILCGGVGSRFWPRSRSGMPKQFLDMLGCGQTLLQLTVDRVRPLVRPENIILLTNRRYADIVRRQLPDVPEANILLEPARRNTAPCICWAAHHIAARCPEAAIVTLPSDHLIVRIDEFRLALAESIDFARTSGGLLTLGIQPTAPSTGYGYIQRGRPADAPGFFKVRSFTEKPNLEMAKTMIASGEFFWNAGIFIWTAQAILQAFAAHAQHTADLFDAGLGLYNTPAEAEFIEREFPNAPANSIDYAVMEKASNVFVKPVDIGWTDLGTWRAIYESAPLNAEGNLLLGSNIITHDCSGSIITADPDRAVVAVGLKDYIVAQSGNAVLVCPISEEQRVRHFVNAVHDRCGEQFT